MITFDYLVNKIVSKGNKLEIENEILKVTSSLTIKDYINIFNSDKYKIYSNCKALYTEIGLSKETISLLVQESILKEVKLIWQRQANASKLKMIL